MPLFLLFVAVPIVEIALFIQVGGWLGLWPTLLIVVLTALAGTVLVRMQGLQTLRRLQANLAEGRDPVGPIAHGALILAGGILLLTPGFFTDAVALALLVPKVRAALISWGASRLTVVVAGRAAAARSGPAPGGRHPGSQDKPVEADYIVLDEPADPPSRAEPGHDPSRARSKWSRPPP